MRVTFVKVLVETPKCAQFLWRVIDNKAAAALATHVVTSSVNNCFAHETMAFWANEAGEVVDWGGLATEEPNSHVACLEAAGFEVVNHV
jgi:hypothetical protein